MTPLTQHQNCLEYIRAIGRSDVPFPIQLLGPNPPEQFVAVGCTGFRIDL